MGALAEHCAFDNNVGAEPCRRKFGREERHASRLSVGQEDILGTAFVVTVLSSCQGCSGFIGFD